MGRTPDELATKRARSLHPREIDASAEPRPSDPVEDVAADASAPEVLDVAAAERDAAADVRDLTAEQRARSDAGGQVSTDQRFAARDRAAAALDRQEAALDRNRAAQYLAHAYRDELTGALQREAGRDQLSQALDRARRTGESLVVAFLDVDHLKRVNDERGHSGGDTLLREVGAALRQGLRSYDVIVRYGGDEFVCALPDSRSADATRRFNDVTRALSKAYPGGSMSIGLVELTDTENLDEVIARADQKLYSAKHARQA